MLERATSVVETVRALARGVMPSVLRDHGLAAALKATVRRAAMDGSVDVDLSLQAEGLDGDVEASLYLCGRAVIDHASTSGAAAVSISVTAGSDVVHFEMGHGGDGPPAAVAAADLATAEDRIVALGGVVEMVDVAGFRLTGTMPTMAQDTSLRKVSTA
jgi:signal transduction histidine kinase